VNLVFIKDIINVIQSLPILLEGGRVQLWHGFACDVRRAAVARVPFGTLVSSTPLKWIMNSLLV
jgi:hypothetical protein